MIKGISFGNSTPLWRLYLFTHIPCNVLHRKQYTQSNALGSIYFCQKHWSNFHIPNSLINQSFRNEGIYYEAVTNKMRDDLVLCLKPKWLQIITNWKGRGGIRSSIIATYGECPV